METNISGEGWALIITAAGTAIVLIIRELRTNKAVGRVEAKQVELETTISEIDHAVNGKQPGAQSIASQVDDLHKEIPVPEVLEEINGQAVAPMIREMYADWLITKAASQKAHGS